MTAFAYLTIQILLSVSGIVEYHGPPDEEYSIRDPAMIAAGFGLLSIACYVTTLLCGMPLIYMLKRYRRLSRLSLILGATILGSVVLPLEMSLAVVVFEGKVSNWFHALAWDIAVGAASGCFTAYVFQVVVGIKDVNCTERAA